MITKIHQSPRSITCWHT